MKNGVEGPYKTVSSKILNINNNKVRVTFRKLPDGQIKISDAWIEKLLNRSYKNE